MTDHSAPAQAEAMSLLTRLRSGLCDEAELSSIVVRLNAILPDPNWFDYAIDHTPELPVATVVTKAFSYRAIHL
jgi:hypothetical protein